MEGGTITKIRVNSYIKKEIKLVSENYFPNEVCGLLSGTEYSIQRIYWLTNVSIDPRKYFYADENDLFESYLTMNKNYETWIGIIHSHPISDAVPSLKDLKWLGIYNYSNLIYAIYSVSRQELKMYWINKYGELNSI